MNIVMTTAAGPAFSQASTGVHLVAASAGTVSFLLIWLTTVTGIALRNGWLGVRIRHSSLHGLHMIGASTGLILGLLHGVAQLAAPVAKVAPVDLVLPFGNRYDPVGIGVGVLGLEIMLAAALSVPLQRRLGFTRWRLLHNLNHVAFMLLVAHVLISGSDVGRSPVWLAVLGLWLLAVLAWAAGATGGRWAATGAGGPLADARPAVRVDVDAATCRRFGFCEHEAPDVFRLRDDGRLAYRTHVSQDRSDAVLRAATACPVRAVLVRPVQGSQLTAPTTGPVPVSTTGPAGTPSPPGDPDGYFDPGDTDGRGRVVPLAHRGSADRRRSR